MYFPALKNAIQHLEEKTFYGVALMYLEQIGYRELNLIDGPGDGGRDVICSRTDLRIQLSVRKDWEKKINEEATKTRQAGKRHLIYVTNRIISPEAEETFRDSAYSQKGEVDVTIADLRRIATSLARPGVIGRAYEMLGMAVPVELSAEPRDVAISTILLFSRDAHDLRKEIIEANLRAQLLRSPGMSEDALVQAMVDAIPGTNVARSARSALSRLRASGRVQGGPAEVRLSDSERAVMEAAQTEFLAARKLDVQRVVDVTGLNEVSAARLLDIALELLVRNRDPEGVGPIEESLKTFLAEHRLSPKRIAVFEALASSSLARLRQYGETVDQILATNSFDIYRALGRRTQIAMVLDASVAMPVLFGLAFRSAKSRYGIAALALKAGCDAHNIRLVVPRDYLNEMAAHGKGALEKLEIHDALPSEAREALRASENAYLSHYTHIAETVKSTGDELTLKHFLDFFGISAGRSLQSIENRIESLLDQHGIKVIRSGSYDKEIRIRIKNKKPGDPKIVVDHDAAVTTMLKNEQEKGFILATWDKVMIDLVEELARVYADKPTRVIDFLSMAEGQAVESNQSYELLATLLHMDERIAAPLARKIEEIRSVEQAYKLDQYVREARQREGESWQLQAEHVALLIEEPATAEVGAAKASPSQPLHKQPF